VNRGNDPTPAKARAAGVIAAALVVCLPASARAAEVEEPIVLHYSAPASCPTEAEFVSLVRAQTSRWTRVAEDSPSSRTMRVVLSTRPDGANGKLVVASPKGGVSEREIAGPNCTALSRALALMVAVAIDPLAGEGGQTNGSPADRMPVDPPPAEPSFASPDARSISKGVPPGRRWPRISLEARAEATSAVVRGALVGMGVSMKLELPPDVGPDWVRAWQPSIGLGIRQSFSKELALRGGSAEFSWTAGHLRLCPFRITLEQVFAISPCAEVNVGRLNAAARGFAEARAVSTFWYDVGASFWTSVNLSSRVFLGSTLLVTAPVTRQPFALASGTIVSDAPVVGVLGGIGLGVTM